MNLPGLITETKLGSNAAAKGLFDLYSGRMLMLCRRYVKVPEDAEEVMLDGFRKFYSSLLSFNYESDAGSSAWLKKIMINECLMFLRKRQSFKIVSDALAEDISLREDVFDHLSAKEIFNLIILLPVGYRTVFNLFVVEGISHQEIARLLNITEGTSKSQLSKGKILLQKLLIKNGDYDDRRRKS